MLCGMPSRMLGHVGAYPVTGLLQLTPFSEWTQSIELQQNHSCLCCLLEADGWIGSQRRAGAAFFFVSIGEMNILSLVLYCNSRSN